MARAPDRQDDVESRLPFLQQVRHDFGRILKIRIQGDDRVAAGEIVAAREGELVSEVAAEQDAADARVGDCEIADFLPGVIAASIVDENQLGVELAVEGIGQPGKFPPDVLKHGGFVVARYDKRNQRFMGIHRRFGARLPRSACADSSVVCGAINKPAGGAN